MTTKNTFSDTVLNKAKTAWKEIEDVGARCISRANTTFSDKAFATAIVGLLTVPGIMASMFFGTNILAFTVTNVFTDLVQGSLVAALAGGVIGGLFSTAFIGGAVFGAAAFSGMVKETLKSRDAEKKPAPTPSVTTEPTAPEGTLSNNKATTAFNPSATPNTGTVAVQPAVSKTSTPANGK